MSDLPARCRSRRAPREESASVGDMMEVETKVGNRTGDDAEEYRAACRKVLNGGDLVCGQAYCVLR